MRKLCTWRVKAILFNIWPKTDLREKYQLLSIVLNLCSITSCQLLGNLLMSLIQDRRDLL